MREFGKIHRSFWTSPEIRALGESPRTLAAYLLTGPHSTMLGCFRIPDAYVAEDLGWDVEGVRLAFAALADIGFALRDEVSKWVVIPNFLKWNCPENPNQVKALKKVFAAVPDFEFMPALVASISAFVGVEVTPPKRSANRSRTVPEPFPNPAETASEPRSNPIETKEQEKEQEQRQRVAGLPAEPSRSAAASAPLPSEQILAELRRHPVLEPVATQRFAEALLGRAMSGAKHVDWVCAAIAEAAVDASEAGLKPEALASKVRKFADNARPPRRDGPAPGEPNPDLDALRQAAKRRLVANQ